MMKKEDLRRYYESYNREDHETIASFYSDDVIYEFQGETYSSKKNVFAWFVELQKTVREIITPISILVDTDRAAVEIESEFKARVDLPDFYGKKLKKGDKHKVKYAAFYDLRDNQFCYIRIYSA